MKRALVSLGLAVLHQAVSLLEAGFHAKVPALGAPITCLHVTVDTPSARVEAEAQRVTIRQPMVLAAQLLRHGRDLALGFAFAFAFPFIGLSPIIMLLSRPPRFPWATCRRHGLCNWGQVQCNGGIRLKA